MKISRYNLVIVILLVAFSVVLGLLVWNDRSVQDEKEVNTNTQSQIINTTSMGEYAFPGILPDAEIKGKKVKITTEKGNIVIELYAEDAPKAVSNFIYLAKQGYYDGVVFHRIVTSEGDPNQIDIVQGGDPTGTGTGGPGYTFEDEAVTKEYTEGIVAMAKTAEPNSNGSQFFINTGDNSSKLQKTYSIFGKVIEGMDVVKKLVEGDAMTTVVIE